MRATVRPLPPPADHQLPDDVLAELVGMMFTAVPPVVVMGIYATGLAALFAVDTGGPAPAALAAACFAVTVARIGVLLAYRRCVAEVTLTAAEVRSWQRRYAIGSYSFGLTLGLLNAAVLMGSDVLPHLLATGLIFGYGAGLATRIAVRPVIAARSLLLATVPTVLGLATHFGPEEGRDAVIHMSLALLIGGFALTGLETIRYVYRSTLQQILVRREFAKLAREDALTGLPNRLMLRDRFEANIVRIRRGGRLAAVHVLDLDRFKAANDQYGHLVGDALLQAVAQRLRGTVAEQDIVARIGGDEFVVMQSGIQHEDEARMLAHRIVRVISAPYRLGEHTVQIGTSIGIAIAPRDGIELEGLASRADAALYIAKQQGRGRVILWADLKADGMPVAV